MITLKNLLIFLVGIIGFFVLISQNSIIYGMEDEKERGKVNYAAVITKADQDISELERFRSTVSTSEQKESLSLRFFDAYMQKGAGHFHLGERDKQLECYKKILGLEALPKIMRARTHTNLAVVHIHLNNILLLLGTYKKQKN
ncbi:MAG: hypothetical protein JSS34_07265 [Proteobacteria bacterium]|nr:hypothetical protein [Pseudomonadota bacterium]